MTNRAARGAVALVFTQGLYFVFGYLAVVVLARELGPVAYGAYGVIMSVLIWVEQSARRAVPVAAAKLIAATPDVLEEIASTAVLLNLLLHLVLFVGLWLIAPWLEIWFQIENGTFLFRLAAVDLPLFGIYMALQGIRQGQHRFYHLGLSDLAYALAKLLGIVLIVALGISIKKALIVNIAASVIGLAILFTRSAFRAPTHWRRHAQAVIAIAAPMAVYSITSNLVSSFDIWALQVMTSAANAASVGLYVAALNIARVPGFALSTVSQVLLPTVAKALAANDHSLIRHYINQGIRFFLILYLPICLVLFANPEGLMRWIYSSAYAGGAAILIVLVLAHGLSAIHAIFSSVLVAVGQVRTLGLIMATTTVLALPVMVGLIHAVGPVGAAIAHGLISFANVLACYLLLRRRFGSVVRMQNIGRITVAGSAMVMVNVLCVTVGGRMLVGTAAGLLTYGVALILLAELRSVDFAAFLRRTGAK